MEAILFTLPLRLNLCINKVRFASILLWNNRLLMSAGKQAFLTGVCWN
jgi:hypothetical protein